MMDWSARVIFCDDIREEFNGKIMLIGIYQGALITSSFPLGITLATYVDVRGIPAGKHKFEINSQYESESEILDLGSLFIEVNVSDDELPVILQGGGMNVPAEKPGKLNIFLTVDDEQPRIVDTLKFLLASPAA